MAPAIPALLWLRWPPARVKAPLPEPLIWFVWFSDSTVTLLPLRAGSRGSSTMSPTRARVFWPTTLTLAEPATARDCLDLPVPGSGDSSNRPLILSMTSPILSGTATTVSLIEDAPSLAAPMVFWKPAEVSPKIVCNRPLPMPSTAPIRPPSALLSSASPWSPPSSAVRAAAPATLKEPTWPVLSALTSSSSTVQVALTSPAPPPPSTSPRRPRLSPTSACTSVCTTLTPMPAPTPVSSDTANAPAALHRPSLCSAVIPTCSALTAVLLWMEALTSELTTLITIAPVPATLAPLPAEGVMPMISSSWVAVTSTRLPVTLPLAPIPALASLSVTCTLTPPPTALPSEVLPNRVVQKLPAIASC